MHGPCTLGTVTALWIKSHNYNFRDLQLFTYQIKEKEMSDTHGRGRDIHTNL
jgi:hypothetical protein